MRYVFLGHRTCFSLGFFLEELHCEETSKVNNKGINSIAGDSARREISSTWVYPTPRVCPPACRIHYKRRNLIMHSNEAPFIMPQGESTSEQKRSDFFPFLSLYFHSTRHARRAAAPLFRAPLLLLLLLGDSSKKALPASRRILIAKRYFPCCPFPRPSFHRGRNHALNSKYLLVYRRMD